MTVRTAKVMIEVELAADPQRVWTALVDEIGQWWRREFYATPNPTGIVIEPHPGGRMMEQGEGGAGLLWYTVIEVVPPRVLALSGDLAPPYGGPAVSLLRLELDESRRKTLLRLTDSLFGLVDEQGEESIRQGWTLLFAESFKQYVESGE